MYIVDDVVYAGEPAEDMSVIEVKVVNELCLLVTFSTKEKRIFDCTDLLQYPVYSDLLKETIFNSVSLDFGIITWNNGDIDISTEKVYKMSYPYNSQEAS